MIHRLRDKKAGNTIYNKLWCCFHWKAITVSFSPRSHWPSGYVSKKVSSRLLPPSFHRFQLSTFVCTFFLFPFKANCIKCNVNFMRPALGSQISASTSSRFLKVSDCGLKCGVKRVLFQSPSLTHRADNRNRNITNKNSFIRNSDALKHHIWEQRRRETSKRMLTGTRMQMLSDLKYRFEYLNPKMIIILDTLYQFICCSVSSVHQRALKFLKKMIYFPCHHHSIVILVIF